MVSNKANQCKTIKSNGTCLFLVLFFVFILFTTLVVAVLFFDKKEPMEIEPEEEISEIIEEEVVEEEPVLPEKIDFQIVVNEWANSTTGNRSVLIYDLDRDELVGEYNPDERYNTASLYKLFVVYDGYRKVQSGEWAADDTVGRTGRSIIECLDLAIRESNSECAEPLWAMIGRENLDATISNDFGIVNSNISSLLSNPNDILSMMRIFYEHEEIFDDSLVEQMKDSFLNQPKTTYNWRQGLPSGFSVANVYNKVGWDYNPNGNYWNIYHDTAIVEFPEQDRHFIVVVMTNRVPYQKIAELGQRIEETFLQSISAE